MRLKLIACKSMFRELSYLAALSENSIDATFMRQGFHESPELLNKKLQAEIDAVEDGTDSHTNRFSSEAASASPQKLEDIDAILLGYGLCSNGIVGLHSRSHRLVVPRGHDCITMLLGSKERYMDCFNKYPGCFWYSGSWIENSAMPCEEYQQRQCAYLRQKDYDEDTLEYCLEEMTGWTKNYHYAAYIKMPFYDKKDWQDFTKSAADFYGWDYKLLDGSTGLLERFISGDWNEEDFLVVPPGQEIYATNDSRIISCREI